MRLLATALVSLAALSAASTAFADAAEAADAEAARLYTEAASAYDAGDVAVARVRMQQSYNLSHRPELLFNLAELDRELSHCHDALDEYREYLRRNSAPLRKNEAERAILELSRDCADPVAAPSEPVVVEPAPVAAPLPPAPVAAAPAKPYWTTQRIAGWSLIGASAAAAATSAYFALRMRTTAEEEEAFVADNAKLPADQRASWDGRGKTLQERGERQQALSWGAGALALVSASAGTFLLWRASSNQEQSSVSLVIAPGRAEAGCSLRF